MRQPRNWLVPWNEQTPEQRQQRTAPTSSAVRNSARLSSRATEQAGSSRRGRASRTGTGNRASLNRLLLSSSAGHCKLLRTRLRSRSRSKLRQLLVPLTRQNRRRRKKTNAAGWCSAVRSEARNRQRRYVLSWRSKALTRKSPPTMAGIVWSLAR